MEVPLEIAYKDVDKTQILEDVIDRQVDRLEKAVDGIISCRIALERPHKHPDQGSGYRVLVIVRLPPNHEVVVKRESTQGELHDALPAIVKEAFEAATRQCREIRRQQQGEVKRHPAQETMGFVSTLFVEEGYGFLRTLEGRDIYFHRNSVLHDDFGRLDIGTGVRFEEEMGEEGPQATTVAIVDKPGERESEPDLPPRAGETT